MAIDKRCFLAACAFGVLFGVRAASAQIAAPGQGGRPVQSAESTQSGQSVPSTEPAAQGELKPHPALPRGNAARQAMLAAARAGARVVAVGDQGVILLSDDGGKSYRQARSVPASAMLNGVSFADDKHGWAVGHWGSILATADGGETWQLQRTDTSVDRPLFSVHFSDASHGVAVGLWSLLLVTADGGRHWQHVNLPPPPGGGKADRNLFSVFADTRGTWYIAAERGLVLRSSDLGATWKYFDTGYKGSFWAGMALAGESESLLVAGLRGTVYRSDNGGKSWQPVPSGSKNSITAFADVSRRVAAVGINGTLIVSGDGGRSFEPLPMAELEGHASLNAVLGGKDQSVLVFSEQGPLKVNLPNGPGAPH